MRHKPQDDDYSPVAEAFKDTSDRFPLDAQLRKHGFKIHSRRDGFRPTWEKSGKVYVQEDAVKMMEQREAADPGR